MKTKLFLIIFLVISVCSISQDRSTYLGPYTFNLPDIVANVNFSSEYYDGKEWFFIMGYGQPNLYFGPLTIGEDGKIHYVKHIGHQTAHARPGGTERTMPRDSQDLSWSCRHPPATLWFATDFSRW